MDAGEYDDGVTRPYGGVEKNLLEWAKEGASDERRRAVTINGIAASLCPHFEDLAPDYPQFPDDPGSDHDDAVKDA